MTESSLAKVLRLAAPPLTEPAALLGVVDKSGMASEDEVHEHLMSRCPWYESVSKGKDPGDPVNCANCLDAGESLTASLTPRTPEASTVDKPTVPPGGPGLFHVKGLHLPPYIQHLWFHLVARYGKQRAYGIAVGVVKKWAAGINPGGKHPTKTHPDVRAAAAKNVAQWEADKAKGHDSHGGHVKATAQPLPATSGQKLIPLPPTPKAAAPMMTAHRVHDMANSLSHAQERIDAAVAARSPDQRTYHVVHLRNHLAKMLTSGQMLAENLRKHYPAEGRELDAVCDTLGLAVALSPHLKASTTAHLLQTTMNEATHAARHADLMARPDPVAEWKFNADHAGKHLRGALEHVLKLNQHVKDNYPAEAKLLTGLEERMSGEHADTTYMRASAPEPKLSGSTANFRKADVPGQSCHSCVSRSGTSCRLVAVVTDPAWVCDSYESSPALAAPAARPAGSAAYAKSFLTEPRKAPPVTIISAPGAGKPQGFGPLHQEPSQTVSPSPPLPPAVDLPSPRELLRFARELAAMKDDDQNHHLQAAVLHLTTAAAKIVNNPVSALYSLRSAQMAIQQEWRHRVQQAHPRVAYVFSANTPPAEQAAQKAVWDAAEASVGQMQEAAKTIGGFVDRVRRAYFAHASLDPQVSGGGITRL